METQNDRTTGEIKESVPQSETDRNIFAIRNLIGAGAVAAALSSPLACGPDYQIDHSGDAGTSSGGLQQSDAAVDVQSGGEGGAVIVDAGVPVVLQVTPFAATTYEASLYRDEIEEWTTLTNAVQGETGMNQYDDVQAGDIIIIHVVPSSEQAVSIPVTFSLSDYDTDVVARGWDQTEFISQDVAGVMVSNTGFSSMLPDLDPSAEGYRFNFVGQGAMGASTIYRAEVLQR